LGKEIDLNVKIITNGSVADIVSRLAYSALKIFAIRSKSIFVWI